MLENKKNNVYIRMCDIGEMENCIKEFCSSHKKICIYSCNSYCGSRLVNILFWHDIKLEGAYSRKAGMVFNGYAHTVKPIDDMITLDSDVGVFACVGDEEKNAMEESFGENIDFLFIEPQVASYLQRNRVTNDGRFHIYDWFDMRNIENEWMIRFIRHHFPKLDIDVFLFGANGDNTFATKEPRDGIKIFYSVECLGEVDGYKRNPKQSNYSHCLPYVDLSLSFEPIDAMNCFQFPYWFRWLFSPEITIDGIKKTINEINNHHYEVTDACANVCRHDAWGTRTMVYENVKDLFDVKFAGSWRNNTNEMVEKYRNNKVEYLKHFCFNLTPENLNSKGYCTEKLIDAFRADAIPLYYGDMNRPYPNVINNNAIIFFDQDSDNKKSRQLIVDLMANKKLYKDFISQEKIFSSSAEYLYEHYIMGLYRRLEYIINRYKQEKRTVKFLGTNKLKPVTVRMVDKFTNCKIDKKDDTQCNCFVYDNLIPNTRYNICMSGIKAEFEVFSAGLYDFKNDNKIKVESFNTSGEINFRFETKDDVGGIGFCIYAGKYGYTKGLSLTIDCLEVFIETI